MAFKSDMKVPGSGKFKGPNQVPKPKGQFKFSPAKPKVKGLRSKSRKSKPGKVQLASVMGKINKRTASY